MRITKLSILIILFVLVAVSVNTASATGTWSPAAPIPIGRDGPGSAVLGNVLHVIGGGGPSNRHEVYDPVANAWLTKAPMSVARSQPAAAALGGLIYVAGGASGGLRHTTLEAYDPATDTWSTKAPMSVARDGLAMVASGGKLYALGGINASSVNVATVECYDPATNTWSTKTPMPTARRQLCAAVVGSKIYAIGGHSVTGTPPSGAIGLCERYDPATDSWSTMAPMPTPRLNMACGVIDGVIHVASGQSTSVLTVMETYDPATDAWSASPPVPHAHTGAAHGVINGIFYVAAGNDGAVSTLTNDAFRPGTPPCAATPAGLVAWWRGEGDAQDFIGTNDGSFDQNLVGFAPGKVGQAFDLRDPLVVAVGGITPGVDVGNAPELHLSQGDFTVELWFNYTRLGGRAQAPLVIKMAVAPNVDGWNFAADGPIIRTGGGYDAGGAALNTGTQVSLWSAGVRLEPGVWYHTAAVKRGNTLELYLNGGASSISTTISVFHDTNTASMGFGYDPTQGDFFVGLLDEISVYNRALSAAEIQAIYDAGSSGKCQNVAPVVTVPADLSILASEQSTTTLAGTATDADGDALTCRWLDAGGGVVAGPATTSTGTCALGLDLGTLADLGVGAHTFSFEASDGTVTVTDDVVVTVIDNPPVADAGPDQSIHAGDVVTLDGSASTDDNTPSVSLVYAWTLVSPSGSAAVLSSASVVNPTFTADVTGTYTATLMVTDEKGQDGVADDVVISSTNLAPTADAGVDILAALDLAATITGTATDPEGDALTYAWTILSAPLGSTAALTGATTLTPSLTPDEVGVYVLSLTGSDPYDVSPADTMILTVISGGDFAQGKLMDACDAIAGFPATSFDHKKRGRKMCKEIRKVLRDLRGDKGKSGKHGKSDKSGKASHDEKPLRRLQRLIARTDGCALRGAVDTKATGAKGGDRDWIVDCDDQATLYPLLKAALDALGA